MKLFIYTVLFLLSLNLNAEVYRWMDENGVVHYSDRPQGNQGDFMFDASTNNKSRKSVKPDEKKKRIVDVMEEDRINKKLVRQKKKKERQLKKQRCVHLKDNLRNIEVAARLYQLDKDGNRVYMSDDERKKSVVRLKADIKKSC